MPLPLLMSGRNLLQLLLCKLISIITSQSDLTLASLVRFLKTRTTDMQVFLNCQGQKIEGYSDIRYCGIPIFPHPQQVAFQLSLCRLARDGAGEVTLVFCCLTKLRTTLDRTGVSLKRLAKTGNERLLFLEPFQSLVSIMANGNCTSIAHRRNRVNKKGLKIKNCIQISRAIIHNPDSNTNPERGNRRA